MKRHSFTLIEVIIAFALLALVSTTLFTSYKKQILLKAELVKAETAVLQRKFLQERLSQILTSAEKPTLDDDENLQFTFDNGIDPEKTFCHHVRAKLFCKNEKYLLELTSLDGKTKREEELFPHAESVSYRLAPNIVHLRIKTGNEEIPYAFFTTYDSNKFSSMGREVFGEIRDSSPKGMFDKHFQGEELRSSRKESSHRGKEVAIIGRK
ncbi:MAG: hypothetical protein ChlgKO_14930 [Chlamydiales bacterium]